MEKRNDGCRGSRGVPGSHEHDAATHLVNRDTGHANLSTVEYAKQWASNNENL